MKFGKLFSTIEGIILVHDFNHVVSSIKWKYEKHVHNLYKDPSYICGFYIRSPKMLSLLHSAGLDKEIVEFMVMDNQEGYTYKIKTEYDHQMYESIAVEGYMNQHLTSKYNFRSNLELMNSINRGIKEENGK